MLIATQPTAAPGAGSFRADCGLSAGDGERLAGDGERLAGDGERLAGDGEQSAVAFQFTVRNHRNRI